LAQPARTLDSHQSETHSAAGLDPVIKRGNTLYNIAPGDNIILPDMVW